MAKKWIMVRLTAAAHKKLSEFRDLCEMELVRGRGDSLFPNRDDLISLSGAIEELIRRDEDHRTRATNSGAKRTARRRQYNGSHSPGQVNSAGE